MSTALNPYLTFPGNAKEAMETYARVFGGELSLSTFGQFGAEGMPADGVMHASLPTPAGTLMASDAAPGQGEFVRGNGVTLSLSGDDETALRGWFEALAEGGTVTMPLEKQVWGDVYGQLTDRFGVAWMVNIVAA
ncbi:MAG: hypothetical protein JWN17_1302 [Frankiales bacterium]|nr:hypothetical protein [Frankiales bacterium]